MKLSTIHSFKGYESPIIFLIVGPKDSIEMVYTGLTRAREHIVVIIHQRSEYREFFATHLEQVANPYADGLPSHDAT
jgi:ATP-dependent exoDNAse (exonuclease V) alpha subunit